MVTYVRIPTFSEDDALARVVEWLKHSLRHKREYPQSSAHLHLPDLLHELMGEVRRDSPALQGAGAYTTDPASDLEAFYAVAWGLVSRGVLRPITSSEQTIGKSFALTEYGSRWVDAASELEWLPSQPGRMAKLLEAHGTRFGEAYTARATEAISCYRAQAYLACCTMCGAAAEAVVLALAAARLGDRAKAVGDYRKTGGRARIERLLTQNQNSHVQTVLPQYLELLKYWRDDAAHGWTTSIGEEEAYVSLLLLLRFSMFADDRWNQLVARDG